ncbi:unnamed protein product [Miscanthus lutarioriparius]|uniref:Uncharacterized protein n=1 Tax=Miscanthus lutarioriparius TaxID=422564 RepID=A0A811PVX8_9POAL|nr:unnamed protein product [Miscanthus lutarioriparius]
MDEWKIECPWRNQLHPKQMDLGATVREGERTDLDLDRPLSAERRMASHRAGRRRSGDGAAEAKAGCACSTTPSHPSTSLYTGAGTTHAPFPAIPTRVGNRVRVGFGDKGEQ